MVTLRFSRSTASHFAWSIAVLICALASVRSSYGVGRGRMGASIPPARLESPRPVRAVLVPEVGSLPFTLPNGTRVDLAVDLTELLKTATSQTGALAPEVRSALPKDSCERWTELSAVLTVVELQVSQFGLSFGYSVSGGERTGLGQIQGSAKIDGGFLSMDFDLATCHIEAGVKKCISVDRVSMDHKTTGLSLSFDVDFSVIHSGATFLTSTPMGKIIRTMMNQGVGALAQSSKLGRLGWSATVREIDPLTGTLIFDAGNEEGLKANQAFEVYSPIPAGSDACSAFKVVAYIHSSRVDTASTYASLDQVFDPRGPRVGDTVMVRILP